MKPGRSEPTRSVLLYVTKEPGRNPNDAGLDRVLREALRHDFPVNTLCSNDLERGMAATDRLSDGSGRR